MKPSLPLLLAVALMSTGASASLHGATIWQSHFDRSPFVVGETIHGKAGWDVTLASGGSPAYTDAAILQPGGAGSRTYLRMYSTGGGNRNTRANTSFERIEDRFNRVELSIAFNWTSTTNSTMGVGFNGGEGGGFFRLATKIQSNGLLLAHAAWDEGSESYVNTETLLIPTSNLLKEHFYQFAADLDFETRTFTISLTTEGGVSVLTPTQESTVFRFLTNAPATPGINSLYVWTLNANNQQLYLESADIFIPQAIPDPGGVALGLIGAGTLLWRRLRRRRARG